MASASAPTVVSPLASRMTAALAPRVVAMVFGSVLPMEMVKPWSGWAMVVPGTTIVSVAVCDPAANVTWPEGSTPPENEAGLAATVPARPA